MRNPLGIHALVWVGGWTHEDARSAIAQAKATGFDLIEIPALDPSLIDAADTRFVLESHGLAATVSLGLSSSADINSEDVSTVARGRDTLLDALRVAEGIGSKYMGGVIYSAMRKYPSPTTAVARANSVSVVKEVAQEAQLRGVTLGLECVNRYETNLLNTVQQTLDYIEEVGERNVVVHADTYHMNIEESDFRSPILACGDALGYVHVGESHRGYLGSGTVNFDELFGALADVNYSGPITFESFSSSVVDPLLSDTLGIWRNLWIDGEDLALRAHSFIEDGLSRYHRPA